MNPYAGWTTPDGLIGVEIDNDGVWVRTRESTDDAWDPPTQMLRAGGAAEVLVAPSKDVVRAYRTIGNAPVQVVK